MRALAFGLAPDDLRENVARHLVDLIQDPGTHIGTGTFGTGFILPVLADAGHVDVAYGLLLQHTPPSWMTMIDRGATTIWEMWDGVDENGKAHFSLNHFSLGSAISFMHTHIAGLRLGSREPGYKRFRVEPVLGGNLTWARARLESPYGPIESEWRVAGDKQLELEVAIPAGTAADIRLPDGRIEAADAGRSQFRCNLREREGRMHSR